MVFLQLPVCSILVTAYLPSILLDLSILCENVAWGKKFVERSKTEDEDGEKAMWHKVYELYLKWIDRDKIMETWFNGKRSGFSFTNFFTGPF